MNTLFLFYFCYFLFFFVFILCCPHDVPLIKQTSDYGVEVSPATTTSDIKDKKGKTRSNSKLKSTHTHPGTLAHPVNCLSQCSVRTQRPQLHWQIVRRFSFWHAKSLITSVCSQRVFPENHWKTAEDNTWISAHRTRSWHLVTLPRSLLRNNPPNFPLFLLFSPPSNKNNKLLVTSCPQFFHIFFWHIFRTYCPHFEWLLSSSSSLRLAVDWSVESTTRAAHYILISTILPTLLYCAALVTLCLAGLVSQQGGLAGNEVSALPRSILTLTIPTRAIYSHIHIYTIYYHIYVYI